MQHEPALRHAALPPSPSEGENLIIQATLGCSFNQCSFCAMYRSKVYVERPVDEIFADIRQTAADWPDAQRVFLTDGDALALPTEHLLAILRELATALPRLTRISCYATPGNIQRKSAEELALLRAAQTDPALLRHRIRLRIDPFNSEAGNEKCG